jgi:hypothetical protein
VNENTELQQLNGELGSARRSAEQYRDDVAFPVRHFITQLLEPDAKCASVVTQAQPAIVGDFHQIDGS